MITLDTIRTALSPLMKLDVVHSIYVIVEHTLFPATTTGYSIYVFTVLSDYSREARFRVYGVEAEILDLCGFLSFEFETRPEDFVPSLVGDTELIYERDKP